MYNCYLDLVIGNPPKDPVEKMEWLDVLETRIAIVLSAVGVLPYGDELEMRECYGS